MAERGPGPFRRKGTDGSSTTERSGARLDADQEFRPFLRPTIIRRSAVLCRTYPEGSWPSVGLAPRGCLNHDPEAYRKAEDENDPQRGTGKSGIRIAGHPLLNDAWVPPRFMRGAPCQDSLSVQHILPGDLLTVRAFSRRGGN